MKAKSLNKVRNEPFLYYKTKEDIESYRKKPVKLKLQWLQEQMEFFHKAMPEKAKRIRERLNGKTLRTARRERLGLGK